jgi:hypothetical protein
MTKREARGRMGGARRGEEVFGPGMETVLGWAVVVRVIGVGGVGSMAGAGEASYQLVGWTDRQRNPSEWSSEAVARMGSTVVGGSREEGKDKEEAR